MDRGLEVSIRAFIAVEIENPNVLSNLIRVRDMFVETGADLKPVEDENIHLTIRFLGEVSHITIEEIKRILSSIPSHIQRFEMKVFGVGAFPSIIRPRVIWAGVVGGVEQLAEIRKIIDEGIAKARLHDVHRDQHEFSPHITLARIRSGRNISRVVELLNQLKDYDFGVTPVTEIKLKQSTLTPRGPIYRDLYVVKLG